MKRIQAFVFLIMTMLMSTFFAAGAVSLGTNDPSTEQSKLWETTIPPEILNGREPRYGMTNAKDVNVRQSPSTNAKRAAVIAKKGTVVAIIDSLTNQSGEVWYCVWLNRQEVYILSKFIDMAAVNESIAGNGLSPGSSSGSPGHSAGKPASTAGPSKSSNSGGNVGGGNGGGGEVWIPTNGGKRYHRTGTCSNMKNPRQVTKQEAKSLGFTPCAKCKPGN
ncbi:MAG: SH3 domain-containing protein [Firmicutes bacterium]|nr:SH3 domain-containing protein [Bacillota bacterium]